MRPLETTLARWAAAERAAPPYPQRPYHSHTASNAAPPSERLPLTANS